MDRESQLSRRTRRTTRGGGRGGRGGGEEEEEKEEEEEEEATDIKSNNPHLAGGEKQQWLDIYGNGMHIYIYIHISINQYDGYIMVYH